MSHRKQRLCPNKIVNVTDIDHAFHCFSNSPYFPDVTVRWRVGVSVSRAAPGAGRARASMSSGQTIPRTSRSHSTSPPKPGSRTRSERHPLGSQVSSERRSFVVLESNF